MKYGAIDIGTNSMRLLLAEYVNNSFVRRKKIINTTRLGRGIDSDGIISDEAIDQNIEALKEFKEKCKEYGCEEIFCIATAALRNALNSEKFVRAAKEESDIDVDIISGKEEATLGYAGVVAGFDLGDSMTLIVDIGGGSTEFILGDASTIYYTKSIDVGALLMTERFITHMPETKEELFNLYSYIDEEVSITIREIKELLSSQRHRDQLRLIGIGGTITSVSAINQELEKYSMDKIHASIVTADQIDDQIATIKNMSLDKRRKIKGLQSKRAEIILSGELILKSIIKNSSAKYIQISEYDNLEGLIFTRVVHNFK